MRISCKLFSACLLFIPTVFFHVRVQQAPQAPSSNSGVTSPLVPKPKAHVLITISDNQGHITSEPNKNELVVHDDKKLVEVAEVRSVRDDPLVFSLLVDYSGSSREMQDSQVETAIRLSQALSKTGNRGYLILFTSDLLTNDHFIGAETVEQILRKNNNVRKGSTALYDAIVHACTKQLNGANVPQSFRRAIFVFSDGGDNSSRHSLEQTLEAVQGESIPIFSIGISSRTSKRLEKLALSNLRALSLNRWGRRLSR